MKTRNAKLKCWRCEETKPIKDFRLRHRNKNGVVNECKQCRNEMEMEHLRTLYQVIKKMYKYHKDYLNITFDEFKEWCYDNSIEYFYDMYVHSQFKYDFKPALFIKDRNKTFRYDNIELKFIGDLLKGYIKGKKKKVAQYDEKGNLLEIYKSVVEASEKTGVNKGGISRCIKGERNHAGGFVFKLIEDN